MNLRSISSVLERLVAQIRKGERKTHTHTQGTLAIAVGPLPSLLWPGCNLCLGLIRLAARGLLMRTSACMDNYEIDPWSKVLNIVEYDHRACDGWMDGVGPYQRIRSSTFQSASCSLGWIMAAGAN